MAREYHKNVSFAKKNIRQDKEAIFLQKLKTQTNSNCFKESVEPYFSIGFLSEVMMNEIKKALAQQGLYGD